MIIGHLGVALVYTDEEVNKIIERKFADADRTGLFSVSELPFDAAWAVLEAVSDRNKKLDAILNDERVAQGLSPETHIERLLRNASMAEAAMKRLSSGNKE
jgi:hypothetical protein